MGSFDQTKLGNGKKGVQPLIFGHVTQGGERAANRNQLRRAFGNLFNKGLGKSPVLVKNSIAGPFRTSYNAGDVNTNYIEPTNIIYGRESNQVGGNNLSRLQVGGDGISGQNGNAMFSGNPRYVYDGSDYIRFKKLNAINKNYNDSAFGGDSGKTQQHAIRQVRK